MPRVILYDKWRLRAHCQNRVHGYHRKKQRERFQEFKRRRQGGQPHG